MNAIEESLYVNAGALKKLELALQHADVAGKQKKEADFVEAYQLIEKHLARKVPVSRVMKMFGDAYGYSIHAPHFRKLLSAERKRRAELGDVVVCSSCYRPMVSNMHVLESTDDKQEGAQ